MNNQKLQSIQKPVVSVMTAKDKEYEDELLKVKDIWV
tara:strand:+ start:361 stop:471 length:111 start_codon:yes stop_codon:yes gene_type:complete